MHPVLFKVGSIPINTYGLLIAIGFLTALQVIKRLSIRQGLDAEKILDMSFWATLLGFMGARLLFVITRLDYFSSAPLDVFKVWEGGLVFYGGPLVAVPFMIWYARKHQFNWWKVLDAAAPAVTIAHMFGRFGCLGAGCCYGKPSQAPWAIQLHSDLVDLQLRGVPLHPTQLYEAGALFILFWTLLYIFKTKKVDGQVALSYLIAYPIIRSIVEIFRGDLIRGFVIDEVVSTSQFISILVFIAALLMLYYRIKTLKNNKT